MSSPTTKDQLIEALRTEAEGALLPVNVELLASTLIEHFRYGVPVESKSLSAEQQAALFAMDGRGTAHTFASNYPRKAKHYFLWQGVALDRLPNGHAGPKPPAHTTRTPHSAYHHGPRPSPSRKAERFEAIRTHATLTEAAEALGLRRGTLMVWWSRFKNDPEAPQR
jgi:hypothetical protein